MPKKKYGNLKLPKSYSSGALYERWGRGKLLEGVSRGSACIVVLAADIINAPRGESGLSGLIVFDRYGGTF